MQTLKEYRIEAMARQMSRLDVKLNAGSFRLIGVYFNPSLQLCEGDGLNTADRVRIAALPLMDRSNIGPEKCRHIIEYRLINDATCSNEFLMAVQANFPI